VSFTTKWHVAKYYLRTSCFLCFSRNPRSFKDIEGSLLCSLSWTIYSNLNASILIFKIKFNVILSSTPRSSSPSCFLLKRSFIMVFTRASYCTLFSNSWIYPKHVTPMLSIFWLSFDFRHSLLSDLFPSGSRLEHFMHCPFLYRVLHAPQNTSFLFMKWKKYSWETQPIKQPIRWLSKHPSY